ncbi:DUF721 domain-containing protein [Rhodobacterales bacterium HKCCE2091]|nr:DUF721 domain-containing protein [Rhodobacterales bacterium HKCCE2091]
MPAPTSNKPEARRGRGFEPASKLVAGHLRGPMTRRGFAEAKLLTRWSEIAGPELAAIAAPVALKHGRGMGGTLILLATGSNAPILQMRQAEVIERVNACYGYRAVSRISITQTAPRGFSEGQAEFAAKPGATRKPDPDPAAMAEAETGLARIGDDRLREALGRLARNVLARPTRN